jgi:hypothetical protein
MALAQDDPQGIVENGIAEECTNVAQFVFRRFEQRTANKRAMIVGFLAAKFGERHCQHMIDLLADCLLFGANTYRNEFASVRTNVLGKCWRILQAESKSVTVEKVSSLCVVCLSSQWPEASETKFDRRLLMTDD